MIVKRKKLLKNDLTQKGGDARPKITKFQKLKTGARAFGTKLGIGSAVAVAAPIATAGVLATAGTAAGVSVAKAATLGAATATTSLPLRMIKGAAGTLYDAPKLLQQKISEQMARRKLKKAVGYNYHKTMATINKKESKIKSLQEKLNSAKKKEKNEKEARSLKQALLGQNTQANKPKGILKTIFGNAQSRQTRLEAALNKAKGNLNTFIKTKKSKFNTKPFNETQTSQTLEQKVGDFRKNAQDNYTKKKGEYNEKKHKAIETQKTELTEKKNNANKKKQNAETTLSTARKELGTRNSTIQKSQESLDELVVLYKNKQQKNGQNITPEMIRNAATALTTAKKAVEEQEKAVNELQTKFNSASKEVEQATKDLAKLERSYKTTAQLEGNYLSRRSKVNNTKKQLKSSLANLTGVSTVRNVGNVVKASFQQDAALVKAGIGKVGNAIGQKIKTATGVVIPKTTNTTDGLKTATTTLKQAMTNPLTSVADSAKKLALSIRPDFASTGIGLEKLLAKVQGVPEQVKLADRFAAQLKPKTNTTNTTNTTGAKQNKTYHTEFNDILKNLDDIFKQTDPVQKEQDYNQLKQKYNELMPKLKSMAAFAEYMRNKSIENQQPNLIKQSDGNMHTILQSLFDEKIKKEEYNNGGITKDQLQQLITKVAAKYNRPETTQTDKQTLIKLQNHFESLINHLTLKENLKNFDYIINTVNDFKEALPVLPKPKLDEINEYNKKKTKMLAEMEAAATATAATTATLPKSSAATAATTATATQNPTATPNPKPNTPPRT